MANRRGILKLIGGGVVLAAAGAGGFVAANQPSHAARQAWREAGQPEEFRRRFLSYALLAPNPHNRQPWLVRLDGTNSLTLFCDLDRRLPATDPFDRQITIGFGTFLELLSLAAAEDGYRADITPFPEGSPAVAGRLDARPVAKVEFTPDAAVPDALFRGVLARHTNREVYAARDVEPEKLAALVAAGTVFGAAAHACGNDELAAKLRSLTWRAHEAESLTPATMQESIDVMRIGAREVEAHRDGLSFEGPLFAAGKLTGMMSREALADPTSAAFRQGLDMFRARAASARAFVWLTNDGQAREDELAAGRAYMRLTLQAPALGLAIHPWSQSLQEYPEMAGLFAEVHDLIGGGKRLQMLVRTGYAKPVIAAPRRGLEPLLMD
ncbi:MAG: twin-arginine translocation pathway signal protein [Acidobacteria bacterium]|nr:twin-arginine translocation pathway signal protein [Acidobacteriota bacterium]